MKVHRHENARDFLNQSQAWLLESEPENNLMFGIARRSAEGELGFESDEYWATIFDGDKIVGTAFRTPPHHLAVSEMPLTAISPLAGAVADAYPDLSGVSGPVTVAEPFARHWTAQRGGTWRTKFTQNIHVLRSVSPVGDLPPGALRQMEAADEALILEWMDGFVRDTGITAPAARFTPPLLARRAFYLWEDSEPRSIVSQGRDSPNGACINAVYTPPQFRERGYATAAVIAMSESILAAGREFCCLYTDVNNPTSNSIYRRIGYFPIRKDVEIVFECE